MCPLGFTKITPNGKEVNYNYYDSVELMNSLSSFILENLKHQLNFGIETDVCYCLGTGKNFAYLSKLNDRYKFFKTIVALEHPRFIIQYKLKDKNLYVNKYLKLLKDSAG
ncbi:MAG: DUF4918 family protein [Bacteroidales bacterium]|nr:DUF4918 family protein [Bacteroidales bacterium]